MNCAIILRLGVRIWELDNLKRQETKLVLRGERK